LDLSKKKNELSTRSRLKMKKIDMRVVFATAVAIAFVFVLALATRAQDPSAALYKSKCAACHGPDGTGSATGKTMSGL
jgi:cytochrome c